MVFWMVRQIFIMSVVLLGVGITMPDATKEPTASTRYLVLVPQQHYIGAIC